MAGTFEVSPPQDLRRLAIKQRIHQHEDERHDYQCICGAIFVDQQGLKQHKYKNGCTTSKQWFVNHRKKQPKQLGLFKEPK